jgi:TonB family protein
MRAAKLPMILAFGFVLTFSSCYVAAQDEAPIDDKDITIVHFEKLNYPALARQARISGVVVVRVFLDGKGNVVKAVAISGKESLIKDSLTNVEEWKFQPNSRNMAVVVYRFTTDLAACAPDFRFFMLEGNVATVTACAVGETIQF